MFYAMKKELDVNTLLTNGQVTPIRECLATNVHKKTGFYDPEEFIKVISNEEVILPILLSI